MASSSSSSFDEGSSGSATLLKRKSSDVGPAKGKEIKREASSTFDQELLAMELESDASAARPRVAPINPARDTIVFQQLELEHYTITEKDRPLDMPGPQKGTTSVVRMFGVTMEGHSVMCQVHGFVPYFYVNVPDGFTPSHCEDFRTTLNQLTKTEIRGAENSEVVLHVELVLKESLIGFHGNRKKEFLKITVAQHRFIAGCKRQLEDGLTVPGLSRFSFEVFETNLEYNLRFMVDNNVVGCNWIELPGGTYHLRAPSAHLSHCQIEVDIAYDKFISHPTEGEWEKVSPFRVLSFDIECAGRKGVFPEPEHDPVIQIANMVVKQGTSTPFIRNVFTLGTCAPIAGSVVHSFKDERSMLEAWSRFIIECDPDVITGYNIENFDIWYLIDRAKALNIKSFPYLGRLKGVVSKVSTATFASKAFGARESKTTNLDGRVTFDMIQIIQRDYKLRSYSLNSVCAHFLSEQKEDVHHSIISDLQNGNEQTRKRLAVYCMKDAFLPLRLMDKLMCLFNYIEMARVTGVPFSYLLSRGQQVKVLSQLMRKARTQDLVFPVYNVQGAGEEQYEGATVIEPKKGFYDLPIATLDFASLYPSIMMAHNLCYTTLLSLSEREKLHPDEYIKTPSGDYFVKAGQRKGLLPEILQDLLAARKKAKADLKKETDPFRRAVLDGRQLALKISANSVYGFTGATVGKLPCIEISQSVTAFGRQMIEKTRELVETRYTMAQGHDFNAEVIYGDTDSVMVKFGSGDIGKVMDLARDAAQFISSQFVRPINLEFEKVYFPYLLINKKRYAGLYWTKTDKYDKMDAKGIVTVRRDNCPLVVSLINNCLRKLLIERDVEGAIEYSKEVISDLLCNRIDISQLVITKQLSKEDYAGKQAHVELAKRMRKRDAGSAPAMGDRVAYVITQDVKGSAAYEKAEDPIYVLEHSIPLDTQYYLENQLSKPLLSIFEPIMGETKAKTLLSGEHTRTVVKVSRANGGLMKFTQKTETCIGCKAVLEKSELGHPLCRPCMKDASNIYQKEMVKLCELEEKFSRLWSQCQRCQGSLHQDVLCTSKDCPIFYMRKKVQNDARDQQEIITRFDSASCEW